MASTIPLEIRWELLPDDYVLDDEPVDNINQPLLAAALTESLVLAGKLPENALLSTNYGICATVNQQIVVKAPDWSYVPAIQVPRQAVKRSYTPNLQGNSPVILMEFLSDTAGSEYSSKPTYPPGKWFFYEQVLQVPNYVIFEPDSGTLELYRLDGDSKRYNIRDADSNNRYWIAEMGLFLGIWQGSRDNRTGYWLRWWDEQGNLLLWAVERIERGRQQLEQERQRAETAEQRALQLAEQLRSLGS